ncbi:hypothetical protein BHE74_00032530 [Ensete ventricosum]|nr:hypothetical protein GW17_00027329 [Ensete ventricosum]RWW60475.1 hypothetical protein BHE74_00032530 [Ensete ventricosum]RZS07540.1 hypothetical protein BHM03_00038396 [Ensete ventricosum]
MRYSPLVTATFLHARVLAVSQQTEVNRQRNVAPFDVAAQDRLAVNDACSAIGEFDDSGEVCPSELDDAISTVHMGRERKSGGRKCGPLIAVARGCLLIEAGPARAPPVTDNSTAAAKQGGPRPCPRPVPLRNVGPFALTNNRADTCKGKIMDSRRASPGGSRPKLRKAWSPHQAVPISPRHFTPNHHSKRLISGPVGFSRQQSRGKPERAVHVRCHGAMTLGRTQANRCCS